MVSTEQELLKAPRMRLLPGQKNGVELLLLQQPFCFYIFIYLLIGGSHVGVIRQLVWRSGDNLWDLVFSFCRVDSRDWTSLLTSAFTR